MTWLTIVPSAGSTILMHGHHSEWVIDRWVDKKRGEERNTEGMETRAMSTI